MIVFPPQISAYEKQVGTHRLVVAVVILVAPIGHAEPTHREEKDSSHKVGQHLQTEMKPTKTIRYLSQVWGRVGKEVKSKEK